MCNSGNRRIYRWLASSSRVLLPLFAVIALAVQAEAVQFSTGQAYFFDVNGTTSGFGTPTSGGTYTESGNFWNTDPGGLLAPGAFNTGGDFGLAFGTSSTDFMQPGGGVSSLTLNMDEGVQFLGITVNSSYLNVTLTGTSNGNKPWNSQSQVWSVAAGSTLTDDLEGQGGPSGNNGMNFNNAPITLAGGGTINFQSALGANDNSSTASPFPTITENDLGAGLVVNLYSTNNTTAPFAYGGFTLTSGTLNFATAGSIGTTSPNSTTGAFSGFKAGTLFTIGGGTNPVFDNTSGVGNLDLSLGAGSYVVAGSFTYKGTSSLNLGTSPVALTASPTITVSNNTLEIDGIITGTGLGITKAGGGTLLLTGNDAYTAPPRSTAERSPSARPARLPARPSASPAAQR